MAYMATQTQTGPAEPQLESLLEDTSLLTVVLYLAIWPRRMRIFKAKTKHIDVKYRHTHDEQKIHKTVDFHYVNTELNLADLLTKSLTRIRHESLVKRTGLCCSEDKVDGMQKEGE